MDREITWTAAAAAIVIAAIPATAEARFGKRSSSSSDSAEAHEPQKKKSSSTSSAQPVHEAVPVSYPSASEPEPPPAYRSPGRAYEYSTPDPVHAPRSHHCGWGFGYRSWWLDPVPEAPAAAVLTAPLAATLTVDGQAHQWGASLGAGAAAEGERWGVSLQYVGIFAVADDGSQSIDAIHLFNAHLTFALVGDAHGRIRLELGGDSAFAPDLIVLGPSIGVSGAMGLVGPFGIEAQAHLTPFPFRQVDWNAGLTLTLGRIALRAGWRQTWLDDAGLVDGVAHQDVFSGPYLGVALAN